MMPQIVTWLMSFLTLGIFWSGQQVQLCQSGVMRAARACRAVERRIVAAKSLYAVGAALCVVNDYASIGFIVVAQLNFAIAPRIPLLSKI